MELVYSFLIVLTIYTVLVYLLSWWGYKKTKDVEGWMIANWQLGGILIGFSYSSTYISAVALIGFVGLAASVGHGLLWEGWNNALIATVIPFLVWAWRLRVMSERLGAATPAELVGMRYGSRGLEGLIGLIFAVLMVPYMIAIYKGVASMVDALWGLPYFWGVVLMFIITIIYVIFGGIRAEVYTDAFQGIMMVAGILVFMIPLYMRFGGPFEMYVAISQFNPKLTSFPAFGTATWISIVNLIIVINFGGWGSPHLIQRFLALKDRKGIFWALPIAVITLAIWNWAYEAGVAAPLIFKQVGMKLPATDYIAAELMKILMPQWAWMLWSLAITAAAMSTIDSVLHVASLTVSRDLFQRYLFPKMKKELSERGMLRFTWVVTLIIGFVALIWALYPPTIVALISAYAFSLLASAFTAPLLLTLYWRRATLAGASAGVILGFLSGLAIYQLHISFPAPVMVGIPVSLISMIVVSLVTKPPPQDLIDKCFKGVPLFSW